MSATSLDLLSLAHRLEKLETGKSRLRLIGILLPIIMLTVGFSFKASSVPKEIVAEQISLVAKDGNTRLKMGYENGVPKITLTYPNGEPNMIISEGKLCFYDKGNKARININITDVTNSSCLAITDVSGKKCLTLNAGPDGPYLSIDDNEEQREVVLCIDPVGSLNFIERSSDKLLQEQINNNSKVESVKRH